MTGSVLHGTPVVNGLACATAVWMQDADLVTPLSTSDSEQPVTSVSQEQERYLNATKKVRDRLQARSEQMVGTTSDVLATQAQLACDPEVTQQVLSLIEQGKTSQAAVAIVIKNFCQAFEKAGGLLAERLIDLKDLSRRIIAELQGLPEPGIPQLNYPYVLLADDLAPADASALNPDLVLALVTEQGGPTSHTSIIARQMGIPCIVATRNLHRVSDYSEVFVDATRGEIHLDFDRQQVLPRVHKDQIRRQLVKHWHGPARLASGEEMSVLANVQDAKGAQRALEMGAQGVGLFRTELCFLGTQTEPSLSQQAEQYAQVLRLFPGAKVVFRTLDAGSDKPVSWASVENEANPALGVRGLRTSGIDQGVLLRQLDAMQLAAQETGAHPMVMAPMVATLAEAKWVVGLIRDRGLRAGIMVEVPAVALQIERYLPELDFVSIGSNDLTQYVMSADRTNPNLATYTDPWQPAVLELIYRVIKACRKAKVPVGICGEAAADPLLAAVLLGMEVSSVSLAAGSIPAVGTLLERVTKTQITAAAQAVLSANTPGEARFYARQEMGLDDT